MANGVIQFSQPPPPKAQGGEPTAEDLRTRIPHAAQPTPQLPQPPPDQQQPPLPSGFGSGPGWGTPTQEPSLQQHQEILAKQGEQEKEAQVQAQQAQAQQAQAAQIAQRAAQVRGAPPPAPGPAPSAEDLAERTPQGATPTPQAPAQAQPDQENAPLDFSTSQDPTIQKQIAAQQQQGQPQQQPGQDQRLDFSQIPETKAQIKQPVDPDAPMDFSAAQPAEQDEASVDKVVSEFKTIENIGDQVHSGHLQRDLGAAAIDKIKQTYNSADADTKKSMDAAELAAAKELQKQSDAEPQPSSQSPEAQTISAALTSGAWGKTLNPYATDDVRDYLNYEHQRNLINDSQYEKGLVGLDDADQQIKNDPRFRAGIGLGANPQAAAEAEAAAKEVLGKINTAAPGYAAYRPQQAITEWQKSKRNFFQDLLQVAGSLGKGVTSGPGGPGGDLAAAGEGSSALGFLPKEDLEQIQKRLNPTGVGTPNTQKSQDETSSWLDKGIEDHAYQRNRVSVDSDLQKNVNKVLQSRNITPMSPEYAESIGMEPKPGAMTGLTPLAEDIGMQVASSFLPELLGPKLLGPGYGFLAGKAAGALERYEPWALGQSGKWATRAVKWPLKQVTAPIKFAVKNPLWVGGALGIAGLEPHARGAVWDQIAKLAKDPQTFWHAAEGVAVEMGVPVAIGATLLLSGGLAKVAAPILRASAGEAAYPLVKGIARGTGAETGEAATIPFRATEGPLTQFAGRSFNSALEGAAQQGLVAGATSQDSEDFKNQLFQGGLLNALVHLTPNAASSIRGGVFDRLFTYRGEPPSAYGKAPGLRTFGDRWDAPMKMALQRTDPSRAATFQWMQDFVHPVADMRLLPDKDADTLAKSVGATVSPSGFMYQPGGPGTRMQIVVKESGFDPSLGHEFGHPIYRSMSDDDRANANHLTMQMRNMNDFVNNYAERMAPGYSYKGGLDGLPTEAQVTPSHVPTYGEIQQRAFQLSEQRRLSGVTGGSPQADWLNAEKELTDLGHNPEYDPGQHKLSLDLNGMTREYAQEEAASELIGSIVMGDRPENWTKNPSLSRRFSYLVGSVAEHMGLPTTSTDVDGPLGLSKGVIPAKAFDNVIREFFRGNLPGKTGLVPETTLPQGQLHIPGLPFEGIPQIPKPLVKGLTIHAAQQKAQAMEPRKQPAAAEAPEILPQPPPAPAPAEERPFGYQREEGLPVTAQTPGKAAPPAAPVPKEYEPVQEMIGEEGLTRKDLQQGRGQAAKNIQQAAQAPPQQVTAPADHAALQHSQHAQIRQKVNSGVSPGKAQATVKTQDQTPPGAATAVPQDNEDELLKLGKTPVSQIRDSLKPDFRDRVDRFFTDLRAHGLNPQIEEGGRSAQYQNNLYQRHLQGGPVAVPAERSYHSYGRAIDWVNVKPDGTKDRSDATARLGWALAKKYGLTGIGPSDPDHIQDANYKSWRDLPKADFGTFQPTASTEPTAIGRSIVGGNRVRGMSTIFARNYDGSIDTQDNGKGFFGGLNTRDPALKGVAVPVDILEHTFGPFAQVQPDRSYAALNTPEAKKAIAAIRSAHVEVTDAQGRVHSFPIVDLQANTRFHPNHVLDLTYGAAKDMGFNDNSDVSYQIVGGDGKPYPVQYDANYAGGTGRQGGGGGPTVLGGGPANPNYAGPGTAQYAEQFKGAALRLPGTYPAEQITGPPEAPTAPGGGAPATPPEPAIPEYQPPWQQQMMQRSIVSGEPPGAPGMAEEGVPFATGGRGMAFMPGKKGGMLGGFRRMLGGKPVEEEGEEEEGGEPAPEEFSSRGNGPVANHRVQPHLLQGTIKGIENAQLEHAAALTPDDARVQKRPKPAGDGFFKGEYFEPGDALHDHLLANVPENERQVLAQAQKAIANRVPMHVTYASAPKEGLGVEMPTRATRQIEYGMASPQARMLKTTKAELAGHSIVPTAVGITLAKKQGDPHQGYIQGVSTNVAANNHFHVNQALQRAGQESPYPHLNDKFFNDLHGYVGNLSAGYLGTGEGEAPSTPEFPNKADQQHWPYQLKRNEADFLNAVVNNTRAKGTGPRALQLQELARKGRTLLNEKGETNPMRQLVEQHLGPDALENTIKTLRAGLIHEVHQRPEDMPEGIRPGQEHFGLTEALQRASPRNLPDVPMAVNFMPSARQPAPEDLNRNRNINQIERDFAEGRHGEQEARFRLAGMGENPEDYRFIKGHGMISPHEAEANVEALTPDEHSQLVNNLRQQWIGGKIKTSDFKDRMAEIPLPEKPAYMPMAGPGTFPLQNVYHGTNAEFSEFSPKWSGVHFTSDRDTAQQIAEKQASAGGTPRVVSADLDIQRPLRINEDLLSWAPTNIANWLDSHGVTKGLESRLVQAAQQFKDYDPRIGGFSQEQMGAQRKILAHALSQAGYDGIVYQNKVEPRWMGKPPQDAYLALDPAQIRVHPPGAEQPSSQALSQAPEEDFLRRHPFPDVARAPRGSWFNPETKRFEELPEDMPDVRGQSWEKMNAPVREVPSTRISYMPARGGGLSKDEFKAAPEDIRQAHLEQKVKGQLANQSKHPSAIPIEVQRNERGGVQYDPDGKPIYKKVDYDIANSPLLAHKGLDQLDNADEHPDEIDENQHTHLNDVERNRLSALRKASAVDTMADRIVQSYHAVKDVPEIAAGKGWYSKMRKRLKQVFGSDNEIFSQLLGATSAKTPVRNNFIQALDAYEQYKAGKAGQTHEQWLQGLKDGTNHHLGFNKHIAKYLEGYNKMLEGKGALGAHMDQLGIDKPVDDDGTRQTEYKSDADALAHWVRQHGILPLQKHGAKYNSNSNAVLKVLAGTWLKEVNAPKTPNFAGNLTGRSLEATIDVWAARHLRRLGYEGQTKEPWRIQPSSDAGVSGLDFAFSQDAMRRAADKISQQTGKKLNPDDLQAVLWYAEKHHYEKQGWTRGQGAAKSSFDEVFDKVFPKNADPMSAAEARAHYQALSESEQKVRDKTKRLRTNVAKYQSQGKGDEFINTYLEKHKDFLKENQLSRQSLLAAPPETGEEEEEAA